MKRAGPARGDRAGLRLPRRAELLQLHHRRGPADHRRLFRRLMAAVRPPPLRIRCAAFLRKDAEFVRQRGSFAMTAYPKYATTVIGAYSVPDWYESLDRLVAVGQLSMGAMADAQFRASAGGDPRSGNRRHRRDHRRRDASAHPQPPFAAQRDAELFLAEDSGLPGQHAAASRSPRTIPTCFIPPPPAATGSPKRSISAWSMNSARCRR